MKKTICLIDTWNSEGYSESGIIDLPKSWDEGVKKGLQEFNERYLSMLEAYDDTTIEIATKDLVEENGVNYRYWSFYDGEDAGCIHLVEGRFYGVLIHPDENDVVVLETEEQFVDTFKRILTEIQHDYFGNDKEHFINQLNENGNAGAHTDMGYEILYNLNNN